MATSERSDRVPRCQAQTSRDRNYHTCQQPLGHDGPHTCGYALCGKVWR